jgi:very-short-patch-repair endonuclease
LATAQDGVVGHDQLVTLGVSVDWIEHRIRSGWLTIVFRGAYAVGPRRITWRGRLRAATLSCGPDAYISHQTAAALHGLRRSSSALIHVTAPPGGREDRAGIVFHRVRNMRDVEKADVDGIPVTSVARTCLDMAASARSDVLDDLLEAAERNGTFDLTAFVAVCKRGRNGSANLKLALRVYQPTGWTRSRLERKAIKALRDAGIRPSGVNVWVEAAAVEVDLLFEDERLAVEIDGGVVHGTTAAKDRDPDRDTKLQLAGYVPLRVREHRLVHEPDRFVSDVKGLLSRGERTRARPGR